ncbi:hypothetical protein ACQP2U_24095 [Nocardia sp. CA-084685]|uniref:TetR/AcrR family transcriptional regulator n=1 Tax=Nocardia sp. CA-084685 TaxID=3239970 RepID=UPI003D971B87
MAYVATSPEQIRAIFPIVGIAGPQPRQRADLRAAIINVITVGVIVSRHLTKSDQLASADPAEVVRLLRPSMLWLMAQADHNGPR